MTFQPRWKNPVALTMATYTCWKNMIQRCYNHKANNYKYYGARGITVCSRWRFNYDAFVEDMGIKPDGMTIERKDNSLGYSKENCRWAPMKDQGQNRRTTRFMELDGEKLSWRVCADRLGINRETFARHARKGLSIGQIQSLKIGPYARKHEYDL